MDCKFCGYPNCQYDHTNKSLLKFLREHNVTCWTNVKGKITVEGLYSYRPSDGGPVRSFTKFEVLEPTWQAVRDWLGY